MKWLVFAGALALGIGAVVHELIHYVVATALASNVTMEWHGHPEVRYGTDDLRIARLVNLAPTAAALSLAAVVVATGQGWFTAAELVLLAFCAGLLGWSKEDWSLEASRVGTAKD